MFRLIRLLVAEQQERVASSALPTGHTQTHIFVPIYDLLVTTITGNIITSLV